MAIDIGPKIGVDGYAQYRKQIDGIIQQSKELSSEMKMVTSAFDKNDKSQEKLSAQMSVLNKQIQNQNSRLDLISQKYSESQKRMEELRKALDQTIQKYGEESEEAQKAANALNRQEIAVSKIRTEYNNAVTALNKMNRRMEELSDTSDDASNGMDDIGDAAQSSAGNISAMAVTIGNLAAQAISSAVSAIKDFATSIWNLDETTEEFRRAQGRLNTAFEAAGYGADTAQEAYTEFYKILGDTDTATEASQLLAQLAENAQDVSTWTQIAAGVSGTFGDSLPIEGLIEASNETAKVGTVTGALADALNWVGISEDKFNEKLADCSSESERNRLIMETLAGQYDAATEAFYRNNEALVASRESQVLMDQSLGKLGDTISTLKSQLQSEFMPTISGVVDAFNSLLQGTSGAGDQFAAAIQNFVQVAVEQLPQMITTGAQIVGGLVSGVIQALPQLKETASTMFSNFLLYLQENLPQMISAGLQTLLSFSGSLRENAGQLVDAALNLVRTLGNGIIQSLPALIENIPAIVSNIAGIINDNAPKLLITAGELILNLVKGLIQNIPVIIQNIPQIIKAIVDVIMAFDWLNLGSSLIKSIGNGIRNMAGNLTQTVKSVIQHPIDFIKGLVVNFKNMGQNLMQFLSSGISGMGSTVVNAVKNILNVAINWIKNLPSQAVQWGKDFIQGLAGGIISAARGLLDSVKSIANDIASFLHFSRPDRGPLRDYETWMPDMIAGMTDGIYRNAYKLENAVSSLAAGIQSGMNGGHGAAGASGKTFSVTVNPAKGMSEQQVADMVMQRMQHMVRQRETVFA